MRGSVGTDETGKGNGVEGVIALVSGLAETL